VAAKGAGVTDTARGLALGAGGILLFACMDAIGKELTERLHPVIVVWARFVLQAVLVTLILAPRLRTYARTSNLRLQCVRALLMLGAMFSFFFALSMMPLGAATAVFLIEPFLAVILAALVLGEKAGPRRWIGVAVGLCGALLIIRPGAEVFQPTALLPLLAALFYAGYAISTRFLGQSDAVWTTVFYSGLLGAIGASFVAPFFWSPLTPDDLVLMGAMGALGTAGHVLLVSAYRYAEASTLAPLTYTTLVWAMGLGAIFFGERPDGWTLAGAAVIAGSGLYVWWRERLAERAR
jgi:drug/metabolite transporter (DMT)-like permease